MNQLLANGKEEMGFTATRIAKGQNIFFLVQLSNRHSQCLLELCFTFNFTSIYHYLASKINSVLICLESTPGPKYIATYIPCLLI